MPAEAKPMEVGSKDACGKDSTFMRGKTFPILQTYVKPTAAAMLKDVQT